jgi:glyoxylase I family protein
MPGGECHTPGGWNRVVLRVTDLPAQIDVLKKAGVKFRNEMETDSGGRQIRWKIQPEIRSNFSSRLDS